MGGTCALRVPHPPPTPPRARPCRSTPTVTGGSALGSWVWVPGRHLITKYLSLLPIPSSCPVVGPLQPGGTWGQDLESPGCLGPSLGRPLQRRGEGRGSVLTPRLFPPIQVGPLWRFWALLGKAEVAEKSIGPCSPHGRCRHPKKGTGGPQVVGVFGIL